MGSGPYLAEYLAWYITNEIYKVEAFFCMSEA